MPIYTVIKRRACLNRALRTTRRVLRQGVTYGRSMSRGAASPRPTPVRRDAQRSATAHDWNCIRRTTQRRTDGFRPLPTGFAATVVATSSTSAWLVRICGLPSWLTCVEVGTLPISRTRL